MGGGGTGQIQQTCDPTARNEGGAKAGSVAVLWKAPEVVGGTGASGQAALVVPCGASPPPRGCSDGGGSRLVANARLDVGHAHPRRGLALRGERPVRPGKIRLTQTGSHRTDAP